jgi:hypothetical protein
VQTFLDNVRAAMNVGGGPIVIASGGSATKGVAPALRTVSAFRVGGAFDTIRTRRNALPDTGPQVAVPF